MKTYLRRWHILMSLLYKAHGGKDAAYTATLILTLTAWLNVLSAILVVSAIMGMELSGVSTKGSGFIVVVATIWGSAFGVSWQLGQLKEYKAEARTYLQSLGKNKHLSLNLMAVWLIVSYVLLFPLALYFYGNS